MIRFLMCLACALLVDNHATAPNLVFILADDLGINDLHCDGRADHRTPHLDRLATEGIRFTSAYCAQPICSPSRAAILTGKTPARLHLTTFLPGRKDAKSQKLLHPEIQQQLPLAEKTLAEFLKENGYATACVGKWHLGGKGFLPPEQGFDLYHPGQANTRPSATEGGKGEYDLTARAEKFMDENRARPFFLFLSHNSPHINFSARANLIESNRAAFNPTYAALVETLDDSVGRLLRKIDDLGLRTNTVVIFTSDNGGLHVPEGSHQTVTHNTPYRAGKGFLYEGGLRIPLIARWPGIIPAGKVTDAPVNSVDWTPTLLALAGITNSSAFGGENIAAILRGGTDWPDRPFFWHFPHYTNQGSSPAGAMRHGDWKLIEHYEDGRLELFHLRDDSGETRNLAPAEKNRAETMRAALARWRENTQAQTNMPNPNFDPALHRAIYQDHDISRYDPATASPAEFERVLAWRKRMNEAAR
jgi:arylsulfatase A